MYSHEDTRKMVEEARPRLYGFVVKRIYGKDNVEEIVQRTFEYVLSRIDSVQSKETFVSYLIKVAQSFIINLCKEQQGYLKVTMNKAHPERIKTFTELQKDEPNELFLSRLDAKQKDYQSVLTTPAKIEVEELVRPHLTDKQFNTFVCRLYNMTYSETAAHLGITSKQAQDHMRLVNKKLELVFG